MDPGDGIFPHEGAKRGMFEMKPSTVRMERWMSTMKRWMGMMKRCTRRIEASMHKVQRWTPRMEPSISRMDRRTSHRELSMLQVEAPMPCSAACGSLSDQCRWLMGLSVTTFDVRVALPVAEEPGLSEGVLPTCEAPAASEQSSARAGSDAGRSRPSEASALRVLCGGGAAAADHVVPRVSAAHEHAVCAAFC